MIDGTSADYWSFAIDKTVRRIRSSLSRLYGLPCWHVKRGYGSFLTLEFGRPYLRVRNPYRSMAESKRVRDAAARRRITVAGEWHLWIYCCDWAVSNGGRLIGDSESKRSMDRAASFLDGQKLVKAWIVPREMRTVFEFDLGGTLETRPYNRTSEQWLLYEPNGNVLTVRADRQYTYGPSKHPDKRRWFKVAS